ncbi:lipid A deacylase LpxR family protein [Tahibacter caeni]|uniref:lipid A deacylase LpxR family protein n=1 Tax=Tahibacter caeni TaxID=1453545 RepID=UPI0021476B32|nr:lipid A deacylase LpxR family protein [Tahibacter caeni]
MKSPPTAAPRRTAVAAGTLLALALMPVAAAERDCSRDGVRRPGPSLSLRIDNDLFGGRGQDQGYSNGFLFTAMSPDLYDYRNDPCLPLPARLLNRYLDWIGPGGGEQRNMVVGIGQALFTPEDHEATALLPAERPYVGALLIGFGYNARNGDHLRVGQLRLGMIGPSARGEQVQNGWHHVIGSPRLNGWDNQLRDEPVFQLVHERMRRYGEAGAGWGHDFITHAGGALGNFSTYLNAGAEWRFGRGLPDDFGSTPLRPAGENTSPSRDGWGGPGWSGHGFLTADARAVFYDVTLDGNSFRRSHSVKRRPFVADFGYGLALTHGAWKFAFARYHRTREFDGQRELPVFGSVTISRRL